MQGDQQVGRRRRSRRRHDAAISTRATGARKRCQRAAVCQLPLLAAASAGETMQTRGPGTVGAAIER